MKIGIVGSGNIGGTAARLFVNAGHEVAIANSRGPETLEDLVAELGDRARAATPEQAVEFGEAVLLAIPWRLREQLPDAQLFEGKITIDAMNPYGEDFQVIDLEPSSSSEEPSSGAVMPSRQRANVVWPLPDSPTSPSVSPDRISRLTPVSACTC